VLKTGLCLVHLRSDASQYQVNMTAVLSAKLFDTHVRTLPQRRAALD
jgi:hypothetical protein